MKPVALLTCLALAPVWAGTSHAAGIIYGSLGNFDCINDTGQTAHGFEIELDDCLPSNVYSTFGAPYNRYGNPIITTDGVNTYVRYESTYNNGAWTVGTDSGTYAPTGGHSLFYPQYGGEPAYPNVPGDHFGIALNKNPSNTIYRWLLDGGNGTLVAAGSNVRVPAPVFVAAPPVNPANPVGVMAVIAAPPAENELQFGEAIWAKVFTTEVQDAEPVELDDLVVGNALVPPDSETEVEWYLLQTDPENPGKSELTDEGDLLEGNEAVSRRYEFYEYIGGYDPENHEALNDNYDPAYVGAFLGNQNVAVNFGVVPEPSTLALGIVGLMGLGLAWRRRVRR